MCKGSCQLYLKKKKEREKTKLVNHPLASFLSVTSVASSAGGCDHVLD